MDFHLVTSEKARMNEDINDIFDNITLAENRYTEDGHKEGFAVGLSTGWDEGFITGVQKGGQIGSEIGFYLGFIQAIRATSLEQKMPKRCEKALLSLESLIKMMPSVPNEDSNIVETLTVIRGKFRQICSLLNICPEATCLPDKTF